MLSKPASGVVLAVVVPLLFLSVRLRNAVAQAPSAAPRIVNIYNFIRNSDYRVQNSEDVLFEATSEELKLTRQYNLPGTWALQYDALINPRYQKLLKDQAGPDDEIAAWWEIPRQLAEKAGIRWRGEHDWDSHANVGFSPGYTPDERRKLVDAYMEEFKSVFGRYPRTTGSWYIDEITLAYMAERYGIIASCNCKDQVGTDGYTLWGGYWNQAYYPSKLNAYMPAQNKSAQLDVPIFRMLGSDPIYQYANANGIYSMEPVYAAAGGSASWVDWFTDSLRHQPCLAFGYAQVGQENSFGWRSIKKGLTLQMQKLAEQKKAGEIRVETLATSGEWFRSHFAVTPPTAVVALDDWRHQDHRSIWYDSRYYRVNFFWDKEGFHIRDLHRFDEKLESITHDSALTTTALTYSTLPIVEGALWATKREQAGMFPVIIAADGTRSPVQTDGSPVVKELNATDLGINQPVIGGGGFNIVCGENKMTITAVDGHLQPLKWAFECIGGAKQASAVRDVNPGKVDYVCGGATYSLNLAPNSGSCQQMSNGTIRLTPNPAGSLIMLMEE
jgi:hypothetical protein